MIRNHHLRGTIARLGLAFAVAFVAGATESRAQRAYPGRDASRGLSFEEILLKRINLRGETSPSDLANLSRLLLLETISMRNYARQELGNSPAAATLGSQMDGLLASAAVVDQLASGEAIDGTPDQAFANLDRSYGQLESTLGAAPSFSFSTSYRLGRVTRVLSQLEQQAAARGLITAPRPRAPRPSGPYAEIDEQARLLARQLTALLPVLRASAKRSPRVEAGTLNLLALVQGFDRFLQGAPSPDDLQSVYRPVRLRALQMNALVLNGEASADVRGRWRAIREGFQRISDGFGPSRTIVQAAATPMPELPSTDAIVNINRIVIAYEASLAKMVASSSAQPNAARIRDEAYRARTPLFRLRQALVAGDPADRVAPQSRALDAANRQLVGQVPGPAGGDADRLMNELRQLADRAPRK